MAKSKKGICARCGLEKNIVCKTPAPRCANCYLITNREQKKTGKKWVPSSVVATGVPPPRPITRTISHADILLETIIKENKIQKIKVEFEISIKIDGIKVTSI